MKNIRAILLGILIWVLIFVEISIFKISLGLTGFIQWLIHYILLIPLVVFASWLYYKSGDKVNGFLLGLVFLIISLILDLAITAPFFTGYLAFFGNIFLWIGLAELVLIVGIYDRVANRL